MTRATLHRTPLEAGDHLDRPTFHERYKRTRDDVKAELLEGVVFMPSPLGDAHSRYRGRVMGWLAHYVAATPGTDFKDNPTVILGPYSEPQPDAVLVIDPRSGGRTRVSDDGYVTGPPELVVEVATSTAAYDLYEKHRDYERAGVPEYVVIAVREGQLRHFVLDGRYREEPLTEGVLHSRMFPGLRLDTAALHRFDTAALLRSLQDGITTDDHAAFVEALQMKGT